MPTRVLNQLASPSLGLLCFAVAVLLLQSAHARQTPASERVEWRETTCRDVSGDLQEQAAGLLGRAAQLAQHGQHKQVLEQISKAMGERPGTLVSYDGVVWRPAREACRNLIRQVPIDTLRSYRLLADPPMRRKLARWRSEADHQHLLDILRTSFFSSVGDDAAFVLGCFYLDQGLYHKSVSALYDVAYTYPDSDIDPAELWPRLALAALKSGDLSLAQKAWKRYVDATTNHGELWETLGEEIRKRSQAPDSRPATWAPSRGAFGADLSPKSHWIVKWIRRGSSEHVVGQNGKRLRDLGKYADDSLLVNKGTAYHRGRDLFAVRAGDGYVKWKSRFFGNLRVGDSQFGWQRARYNWLNRTRNGVWCQQTMSMAGGTVYVVTEPYRFSSEIRANSTHIWACDERDGSVRHAWGRKPIDVPGHLNNGVTGGKEWWIWNKRFRAAPVVLGNQYLLLFEDNDGLCLAAVNRDSGMLTWQLRLFRSFVKNVEAVAEITVKDGKIYVCTDAGSTAAVAVSGSALWMSMNTRFMSLKEPKGWDSTRIALANGLMVVFPASLPAAMAFKQQTGELCWTMEKSDDVSYLVGVTDGVIVTAGRRVLRGADVTTGKPIWSYPHGMSCGRGFIASGSVFVPVESSVHKVNAKTGKLEATLNVATPGGIPVANIFPSDGNLLVAGLGDLYCIENVSSELERAGPTAKAGDHLRRGRILVALGRPDEGLKELEKAVKTEPNLRAHARSIALQALNGSVSQVDEWFERLSKWGFEGEELVRFTLARVSKGKESERVGHAVKVLETEHAAPVMLPHRQGMMDAKLIAWGQIKANSDAETQEAAKRRVTEFVRIKKADNPLSIVELANLFPSSVDVRMIDAVVNHFTKRGLPGAAALFCRRIIHMGQERSPAKRHAALEYLKLVSDRLPSKNVVSELGVLEDEDPDWWRDTLLPELNQQGFLTSLPASKLGFELVWQSEAGMALAVTRKGIYCRTRNNTGVYLDLATGNKLLDLKGSIASDLLQHLKKPVACVSDGFHIRFVDVLSGRYLHRMPGLHNRSIGSQSGFFWVASPANHGSLELVDPLLGKTVWQQGSMARADRWYFWNANYQRVMIKAMPELKELTGKLEEERRVGTDRRLRAQMTLVNGRYRASHHIPESELHMSWVDGMLTVKNQGSVVFQARTPRLLRGGLKGNLAYAKCLQAHLVVLALRGKEPVAKPWFSGITCHNRSYSSVTEMIGDNLVLFESSARVEGLRFMLHGVIDGTGLTKKVLPFPEHCKTYALPRRYEYVASHGNYLVFTNRRLGHTLVYRVTPERGQKQ